MPRHSSHPPELDHQNNIRWTVNYGAPHYAMLSSLLLLPFRFNCDRGSRVRFPTGLGIFLFTTASRMALGPTQPPIQWVPGALSLGLKRLGVKLTTHLHLVPRSKNEWSYTSTPPVRLHGVVLKQKSSGTPLPLPLSGPIVLFPSKTPSISVLHWGKAQFSHQGKHQVKL
jgi:hypothetical protein